MDEGVVKYRSEWIEADPFPAEAIASLMHWRQWCYNVGLIGEYSNGIGYGNISMRSAKGFIISGTQTGGVAELGTDGYTEVIEANIEENRLVCRGPVAASSESLTHAMLYRLDSSIDGVIHVHNPHLWKGLLYNAPTTGADVPYGTPEMAHAIEQLWKTTDLPERKILAMAGHDDGVIAFGSSLDEAGSVVQIQNSKFKVQN